MNECLIDGKECRFTPCTQAQGIICCGRCLYRCSSGCEKVKNRGTKDINERTSI